MTIKSLPTKNLRHRASAILVILLLTLASAFVLSGCTSSEATSTPAGGASESKAENEGAKEEAEKAKEEAEKAKEEAEQAKEEAEKAEDEAKQAKEEAESKVETPESNSSGSRHSSGDSVGSYSHVGDSQFCSEHECIGDFTGEGGYVVECSDGTYSHAGGISGACSHHGGEK